MNFLICRLCEKSVASDSIFCEVCGSAIALEFPATLREKPSHQIGTVSSFFASQTTLCLFTLLVFTGLAVALAPAGWRYISLQTKAATGAMANIDSRSLGANGVPVRCNQIVVIFNPVATVARVSTLLEQLDTTIAFGPNENGAFELSTLSTAAAGVNEALNRASDAVVSASLQRRCL